MQTVIISTLPDGTLIQEPSGAIYVILGGAKFHIPNMDVFNAMKFDISKIRQVGEGALSGIPTVPRDGTVFQEQSGAVYIINKGRKYYSKKYVRLKDVREVWDGALADIYLFRE